MRLVPPLLLAATLLLVTGCNIGGKSRTGLATNERAKESWNAPKFAGRAESSPRSKGPEGVDRTLDRAHEAARTGEFEVAAELYEKVLDQQPTNPAAHHGLAIIADRKQDYARAEEHYLTALRARPTDADLLNDAGYSYLIQNRLQEAETYLSRALENDPRHTLATSNLGHLNARTNRYDEALALFRRVGTESQAQAELARYTNTDAEGRDAMANADSAPQHGTGGRKEFATPSSNALTEKDWAKLPPDRIRAMMDAERRLATSERIQRDRALEGVRPKDDWATEPDRSQMVDARLDEPGLPPIAFAPPGGAPPTDFVRNDGPPPNGARPIGPDGFGNPAPDSGFGGTPQYAADPRRPAAVPSSAWPADEARELAETAPPAGAFGRNIEQIAYEEGLPPWPNDAAQPRSMGRAMSADVPLRVEWGDAPAGSPAPNDAQRRAALLGLNAGHGMLLPLDTGGPEAQPGPSTAGTPRVPAGLGAQPAINGRVAPANVRPNVQPSPAVDRPASSDTWPESTWPDSASLAPQGVQPIATTSPVPVDPSLYRAADGTFHGAARPTSPPEQDQFARARWAADEQYRQEIAQRDADRTQRARGVEADRLAFQGGGAPHPGFDRGFGPPTMTPQPRTDPNERAMPIYNTGY